MNVNVKNYGSSGVTIEVTEITELPIAFCVDFVEGGMPTVQVDWAEWQNANSLPITGKLAPLPPAGKVREAAMQAAEHLAGCADDRLAAAAESLKEYGQDCKGECLRTERVQQFGS